MGVKRDKKRRRARILERLRSTPHVRISALAEEFGVTTETIRRDLDALSAEGLVDRAYGGASARPMGVQPSIGERRQAMIDERAQIGAAAAELVEPGEVLMIDAGATTTEFARQLAKTGRNLTVITNSIPVASELASSTARVILCPGDYDAHEGAVFGEDTRDYLGHFHANAAFVGASAVDAEGISDVNRGAVWVKRRMIQRSERTYLLADHNKFGAGALEVVGRLDALEAIVTDQAPAGGLAQTFQRAGIACHAASGLAATGDGQTSLPDAGEASSER